MPKIRQRFWVYSHDSEGTMINDIGDHERLKDAIDAAAHYLVQLYPQFAGVTVRVVDNELNDGTTIWLAGPVEKQVDLRSKITYTEIE